MDKKFKDLSMKDLEKLPNICDDHSNMGVEVIYLHLWNKKKMHWFLAEYGPINRRFFGFMENRCDGIASGLIDLEEILSLCKKGEAWEPIVDEKWVPVPAKNIEPLQGYINIMKAQPDML